MYSGTEEFFIRVGGEDTGLPRLSWLEGYSKTSLPSPASSEEGAQRKVIGRQEDSLEYYLLRSLLFKRDESRTFENHFWVVKLSRGLFTSKRFIDIPKG